MIKTSLFSRQNAQECDIIYAMSSLAWFPATSTNAETGTCKNQVFFQQKRQDADCQRAKSQKNKSFNFRIVAINAIVAYINLAKTSRKIKNLSKKIIKKGEKP